MTSSNESSEDRTSYKKEVSHDGVSNISDKSNKSKKPDVSEKNSTSEIAVENFDINDDKEKQYNKFLQCCSNEYSVEQMKKFLKYGITENGIRIMTTDTCSWYYDYYKITKRSTPHLKEFTDGATVDYYYYTTPFPTQMGNINLVMMHSQVNFGDETHTPSDRSFKMNEVTPEMIKEAKIKVNQIKNTCCLKSL
ncbi:conserved Plasmodium protein, unknown function [Plasmodium relictum]|uniref:Uncharacterized protein n=1 Tax=Plasmodium relictum TaxID=85471 RepID=A0A1J1H739_PLARL|nr:conserved Plasmodium protein, unknown function [Plasmodium relictum]CRH00475.1 conserved Plasmodium protein, unknown function [Plasmodium relictum]